MKETDIKKSVQEFIDATNQFDVDAALILFAANAAINDVSVGETFKNKAGVRTYLENFFVGYHTVTKLESLKISKDLVANAQVDFTGDFGHETGGLNFTFDTDGLITLIDAHLD
jgi:ketosteroid isomerase-like protein